MLNFVGYRKGSKIIDAGCGSGSYLPYISSIIGSSGEIHAIDNSIENIERVKYLSNQTKFTCPVSVLKGDLRKLNLRNNSFDSVWCSNVFQYLKENEKIEVFNEFTRVVRPGGIIGIKELDLSASFIGIEPKLLSRIIEKTTSSVQFQSTYNTCNLINLKSNIGFQLLKYKSFNVEWSHPLPNSAIPYLKSIILSLGLHFEKFDLLKKDAEIVDSLYNPCSEKYYLNCQNFYWRESYGVAVYGV